MAIILCPTGAALAGSGQWQAKPPDSHSSLASKYETTADSFWECQKLWKWMFSRIPPSGNLSPIHLKVIGVRFRSKTSLWWQWGQREEIILRFKINLETDFGKSNPFASKTSVLLYFWFKGNRLDIRRQIMRSQTGRELHFSSFPSPPVQYWGLRRSIKATKGQSFSRPFFWNFFWITRINYW